MYKSRTINGAVAEIKLKAANVWVPDSLEFYVSIGTFRKLEPTCYLCYIFGKP